MCRHVVHVVVLDWAWPRHVPKIHPGTEIGDSSVAFAKWIYVMLKMAVRCLPILFVLVASASCVIDRHFRYRKPVKVDAGLKMSGYYYTIDKSRTPISGGNTINSIVLWRDGTVAFFSYIGEVAERKTERVGYGDLEAAHEQFQSYLSRLDEKKEYREKGGEGPSWGGFRVEGDSISIQVMKRVGFGGPAKYGVVEYRGKMLNDTTFVLTDLINPRRGIEGKVGRKYGTGATYHFYRWDEKPDSTNWLHERYR